MEDQDYSLAMSLAKILVAGGFMAFIAWKLPIIELLFIFAYAVIIPAGFLIGAGIVTTETMNAFIPTYKGFRERVERHAEALRQEGRAA